MPHFKECTKFESPRRCDAGILLKIQMNKPRRANHKLRTTKRASDLLSRAGGEW